MSKIKVVLDSNQRERYLGFLYRQDGISGVIEEADKAYCAVALTALPINILSHIKKRHETIVNVLLPAAKIKTYDPMSAPLSPDKGLTADYKEVYKTDSARILESRFFTGHNLVNSYGIGIELQKAVQFNRIPVIFFDRKIRFSRMLPHRAIYLAYSDFDKQWRDFVPVFEMLKEYNPGIGIENGKSVLVGFDKRKKIVNLEEAVKQDFPQLSFNYNGSMETVKTVATNPGIFIEHNA